jgi:hypothetical protein
LATGSQFGLAWISRTNGGGAPNVLLPAFVMAAILFGLGFQAGLQQLALADARAWAFRVYLVAVALLQFGLVAYNTRLTVPFRSDQWADERLAARLAELPGPILAPELVAYLRGTDKSAQPMMGPMDEIRGAFGGEGTAEGFAVLAQLEQNLEQRRYRYVVLSDSDCCIKPIVLKNSYVDAGPLFPPGDVFFEWKSWRTPEEHLYVPPDPGG